MCIALSKAVSSITGFTVEIHSPTCTTFAVVATSRTTRETPSQPNKLAFANGASEGFTVRSCHKQHKSNRGQSKPWPLHNVLF